MNTRSPNPRRRLRALVGNASFRRSLCIVVAVLLAAVGGQLAFAPRPDAQEVARTTYEGTNASFPNPERGFFAQPLSSSRAPSPLRLADLRGYRDDDITVLRRLYSMPTFRDGPISASFLGHIEGDFDTARQAGVKLIVRFAYNFNEPDGSTEDAPKEVVLSHIGQLEPVLRANADVIAHVEAGFIGRWGEWHTSTNGLANIPDKRDVLSGLLGSLPKSRMVAVRYPQDKKDIYNTTEPLGPAGAFGGTDRARTGHHNDCFVADVDDWGTYWPLDPSSLEAQKSYLHRENRYVVQSGETCNYNPPRSDCPDALEDLERMRWSSLNSEYHPRVLRSWENQGCMVQIERRLGYRFKLLSSTIPRNAAAGGVFRMSFTIKNTGFASPYNPRKLEIVLRNRRTGEETRLRTDHDPRSWLPGPERTVALQERLPADLPTGAYDLFLSLPDPGLRGRPEYSIRLANAGLWEPQTGYNALRTSIRAG